MGRRLFVVLASAFLLSCTEVAPNVGAFPETSLGTNQEPHVIFSAGVPSGVSDATAISIALTNADTYRSKFATAEAECYDPTGYGTETPISTPIATNLSSTPDGAVFVCACGKNSDGNWQPWAHATFATWTKLVPPPKVIGVTTAPSTLDGMYVAGGVINLIVTFDRDISVAGGTPQLALNDGEYATFTSASNSKMYFSLTVAAGYATSHLNTMSANAIQLNGATVTDSTGQNAVLTIPTTTGTTLADTSNLQIDSIPPSTAGMTITGPVAYFNSTTTTPFFNFSGEYDTGSGIQRYELAIGATMVDRSVLGWSTYIPGSSRSGLGLTEGQTYYPFLRIVDNAGNISSEVALNPWTVDTTMPGIPATFNDGDIEYQNLNSPIITWAPSSDGVSGIDFYEIAIGTGAGQADIQSFVNVAGTSFQYTGSNLVRGTRYYATLRIHDRAHNVREVQGDGWLIAHPLWTTDGTIQTIDRVGDTIYVGGNFSVAGPYTGGSATLDASTGAIAISSEAASLAAPNANVNVSLTLPDGRIVIGGAFTGIGTTSQQKLALFSADGTYIAGFPNVNGEVFALALSSDQQTLYVGGNFTLIEGLSRTNLAAIDLATMTVAGWAPTTNGTVKALAVEGTDVVVGGSFTSPAYRLAIFHDDGSQIGSPTTLPVTCSSGGTCEVSALHVQGTDLYIGGRFDLVDSYPKVGLAKIDMTVLHAYGGWTANTSAGGSVKAMAWGTKLFVGGNFSTISDGIFNHPALSNLASIDPTSGLADSWSPSLDAQVSSLAISGTNLYIGGSFRNYEGTAQAGAVIIDIPTHSLSGWNAHVGKFSDVSTIALSGSYVHLGGTFSTAGGKSRANLAKFDLKTGEAVDDWKPTTNAPVFALKADSTSVYVGGSFGQANGTTATKFVALDINNGNTLWTSTFSGDVSRIDVDPSSDQMYIASSSNVAIFSRTSHASLSNLTQAYAVTAMRVAGSKIYVATSGPSSNLKVYDSSGGLLATQTVSGGIVTGFRKLIDGRVLIFGTPGLLTLDSSYSLASLGVVPNASFSINCAVEGDGGIYFGGSFSQLNGQSRQSAGLADLSGSLISSWAPVFTGSTSASQMINLGGAILIGGSSILPNSTTSGLGVFDVTSGAQLH